MTSVLVSTDFSGREPHRKVPKVGGVGVVSGSLGGVLVGARARDARDEGLIPVLYMVFFIYITPMTGTIIEVTFYCQYSRLFPDSSTIFLRCFFNLLPDTTSIPDNLKALSHQTSSHYVLRTGWPPEDFDQVQHSGHPSPFKKFVAHPGSLFYVQEIRSQIVPVWANVVRTSLVRTF